MVDRNMRVGIVGQRNNEKAEQLVSELATELETQGVEVYIDRITAENLDREGVFPRDMKECDLAVSVGGDGTFLYTVRAVEGTPIIGVNLGEVGFLNAVSPEDAVEAVSETVQQHQEGSASVRELQRLVAVGDEQKLKPAVNEIVVQGTRRGPGGGAEVAVTVNGETYTEGYADGVLIATPTGSSAYNLSEGGPLLYPTVDGLVITQMCPRKGSRPLVVDSDAEIEIMISETEVCHVVGDGRERRSFDPPMTVEITTAAEPLRLAGPDMSFFNALGKLE